MSSASREAAYSEIPPVTNARFIFSDKICSGEGFAPEAAEDEDADEDEDEDDEEEEDSGGGGVVMEVCLPFPFPGVDS